MPTYDLPNTDGATREICLSGHERFGLSVVASACLQQDLEDRNEKMDMVRGYMPLEYFRLMFLTDAAYQRPGPLGDVA